MGPLIQHRNFKNLNEKELRNPKTDFKKKQEIYIVNKIEKPQD